jgi:hypothetical protein
MRVIEEPFVTREVLLSVLRPGELTSERPFRTLRGHKAASGGLPVLLRAPGGQVLGRIQLYSSLNADAARAYRLRQREAARALAERAAAIERSPAAQLIRRAVASATATLPLDYLDYLSTETPTSLKRYLQMRALSTWHGSDREGLTREWLSHSDAWLVDGAEDRGTLMEAAMMLDQEACQARQDILGENDTSATTFYGVVRRMDATAAEIEGADGQLLLIPRDDLERQGLSALGQPVSVLREVLPGGGSYSLPMPAMALEEETFPDVPSPWDSRFDYMDDGTVWGIAELSSRDVDWLERDIAREPKALLTAPLPIT